MTTKKIKTSDILGDNYYTYELTSSNYTPALNDTITITCTMKDVYGAAAGSKSITLYQNDTSKGAKTTNSSGVATWSITCSSAGLQKFNIKDTSIEVFVDDKAVSSHQHGNITSDGKLTTSHNGTYSTFIGVQDSTGTLYKASKINSDIIIDGTAHANIGSNANDNQSAINTAINTALGNKANSTHSHSLSSLGGTVTVEKLATAESGYLSSYAVKQNGVQVGNTINIPKDFLVKSGSVKTVSTANNPVSGYSIGDKYIDLVINVQEGTSTDSHIYILVSDLIDTPVAISDVTGLQTALSGKIDTAGTGLSKSGTTLNHSNSITALTTASLKKVKYDNQGHIIGTADVAASDLPLTNYLQTSDVKNNLTSTDTNKPLSANQGKELKTLIDNEITKMGIADFYIDNATDELVLQTSNTNNNNVVDTTLSTSSNNAIANSTVTTTLNTVKFYELVASNYNPDIDDTITIECTVTDIYGNKVSGLQVSLYENNELKTSGLTDSNGKATWNITCSKFGLRDFAAGNVHCQVKVGGWKTSFSNYDTYDGNSQNFYVIVKFNETTVNVVYHSAVSETVPIALTPYNTEILQDWQKPTLPVTMVDYIQNMLYVIRDNANVMQRRSITGASFSTNGARYIEMQWKHEGLPSTYK